MYYTGTMYADGGTVEGSVNLQGGILHSEGTGVTVFMGDVNYNSAGGVEGYIIESGIFKGNVYNRGVIKGGDVYGTVTNGADGTGSITGGTFYGSIVNEVGAGQVAGGTFAVTFDHGDGTKTELELELMQYGALVDKPADPTRSGYTFAGWYANGTLYDFDTPVTAPLTLTAEWTEVPVQNRYYYTASADTKPDDTKRSSPKTADPGVILYGAAALLSLTGMAALTGRKK